jgi:hypothetical protein
LTPAANLPPVSLTPVANLLPVSTTQGKMVAKFATGVVDTGGNLPPVSTTLAKMVSKFAAGVADTVVRLDSRISPRIFEKIQNGQNGILWGGG